jgi:2-methylcitrate dehydratase PrpD
MTPNQARLCAAYAIACALQRGTVGLDDFKPAALADPARLVLAARVLVEPDRNPDPNALGPVEVTVRLRDGTGHEIRIAEVYGSPARPMTRDAQLAKFRRNWLAGARPLPPAAGERLIALVDGLETVGDVTGLIDLMVS